MNTTEIYHYLEGQPHLWNPAAYEPLDWNLVPETQKDRTRKRVSVWRAYLRERSPARAAKAAGVTRSFVSKTLSLIYGMDQDGRIAGLQALIPYRRQKAFKRDAPLPSPDPAGFGYAGAFGILLGRTYKNSTIGDWLTSYLRRCLKQTAGLPAAPELMSIHRVFKSICRKSGLGPGDYPFHTNSAGYRSLADFVRRIKREFYAGHDFRRRSWRTELGELGRFLPFECTELDEHVCDQWVFAKTGDLEVAWSDGPHVRFLALSRLSVIVEIDVASSVAIGYRLCERRKNNAEDVVDCIAKGTLPWTRIKPALPGLEYPTGPCFPSELGPAMENRSRACVRMDNCLTHYAKKTQTAYAIYHSTELNYGKKRSPKTRGYIEGFFDRLEDLLRNLPCFTGKFPGDERGKRIEEIEPREFLLLGQLSECIEIILAEHNTTSNSGLGGMTPMDYLARNQGRDNILAYFQIPPTNIDLCYAETVEVTVQLRGKCPCINLKNGTYYSEELTRWIDQRVMIQIDRRDGRTGKIFSLAGEYIGECRYEGPLGYRRHHVSERAMFNRWARTDRLKRCPDAPGFTKYVSEQAEQAMSSRRAATRWKQLQRNVDLSPNERPQPNSPSTLVQLDENYCDGQSELRVKEA